MINFQNNENLNCFKKFYKAKAVLHLIVFRLQNNLCKFIMRTHKFKGLFCTNDRVSDRQIQIRFRFGLANLINLNLFAKPNMSLRYIIRQINI